MALMGGEDSSDAMMEKEHLGATPLKTWSLTLGARTVDPVMTEPSDTARAVHSMPRAPAPVAGQCCTTGGSQHLVDSFRCNVVIPRMQRVMLRAKRLCS